MAFQTAPAWMENSDEHHAVIYRQFAHMVTSGASGVVSQSALRVTERDGTADMSVDVAAGGAYVPSTRSVHQGTYPVYNDAVINVPLTASHPTNDRIDRILVQVRDSAQDVALTEDDNRILVVEGEPASVPELPPVGVDDWIELARVLVPASASAITNAEITDVREMAVESEWRESVTLSSSGLLTSPTIPSWVNNLDITWSGTGAGGGSGPHLVGMQFNNDGGSNYRWSRVSDGVFSTSASAVQIVVGVLDNASSGVAAWGSVRVLDLQGVVGPTRALSECGYFSGGEHQVSGSGRWTSFGVESLRLAVTGNFASGSTMWLRGTA